jgi:hypothetical protein
MDSKSLREVRSSGAVPAGPIRVGPTNAAVLVETPSIGFGDPGSSWRKTPGKVFWGGMGAAYSQARLINGALRGLFASEK